MKTYYIKIKLVSDAAFTRGDGVAGVVDSEVQHDELGCPYLSGRALKGILVNECADILAGLPPSHQHGLTEAAQHLFGSPGSSLVEQALWSIGDARLPGDLRQVLEQDLDARLQVLHKKTPPDERGEMLQRERSAFRHETLEALTTLRRQTAMDESGVPKDHSLRTQRVILRETPFEARMHFAGGQDPDELDLILLSACVKSFRRAGSVRNRGRGRLTASLFDENRVNITDKFFNRFKEVVR